MKCLYLLLVFSLSFTSSYSQEKVNELTHYLFPEFTQGVILMKNGIKNNALLNYNSLTEEMIVEKKGKKLALIKEKLDLIDTVFIKDRKFFTLNSKFIELIFDSKGNLYAEHKCRVNCPSKTAGYGGKSQTSGTSSYQSLSTDHMVYELKLPDGYEIKPYIVYWLERNGELNKFYNMRQLKKIYNDKKDLYVDYIKKYNANFDNQDSIVQLIKYLETN
ncbi:hypothetical protein DMA11_17225 [Marinilabiliaceae bacterium JC017]|nr:hypothetical protein DMA11_17225 [Marinilabiliaceae bacterium JC017]